MQDTATGAVAKGDKWEADLGMKIGLNYNLLGNIIFADFEKNGFKSSVGPITKKDYLKLSGGIGTTFQLDGMSKLFIDLKYYSESDTIKGTENSKQQEYGVPLNLGFETQLLPWLILRASISQSFFGGDENSSGDFKSFSNTTEVSTGITVSFGKVNIDGMVGQDRQGNKKGSFGSVTNFSMTYRF